MGEDPTGDYKGHAIVAKALPAPGQKFYSVFTVHTAERTKNSDYFHLVHQEGKIDGIIFSTEADALDDARERAKAWIDTQAD